MTLRGLTLAGVVAALGLAGCGDTTDESTAEPAEAAVDGPVPERSGFASTYTGFDLGECEVLSENREEGSSATYRCPGFGATPLFVQEGDGRFDLDAGVDNDRFETVGAFNDIEDTIEWRLEGDTPIAAIFRFRDVSMQAGGRTVLAVETVGTAKQPGCRIAQIAGDTPDANERARDLADASAAIGGFECGEDEVRMIGNAG